MMSFDDDFFFSQTAIVITASAASVSALSSMLIMFIILRSGGKRTNAYHLIMLCMSFCDTIGSAAMALNTIPMPLDVDEFYPFESKSYGNVKTCETQGAIIVLSRFWLILSLLSLHIFYLLTIRYKMAEDIFKRRFLPVFFSIGIFFSFLIIKQGLSSNIFNPLPHAPFCGIGELPAGCEVGECVRGGLPDSIKGRIRSIRAAVFIAVFAIIVVSLFLVLLSVFVAEKSRKNEFTAEEDSSGVEEALGDEEDQEDDFSLLTDQFGNTRITSIQTLMYILALTLSWLWFFLQMWNVIHPLYYIFMPMFGLYNAIIFVYQKTYIVRKSSMDELSFCGAVREVIMAPASVPEMVFSGIDIVVIDQAILYRQQLLQSMVQNDKSSGRNVDIDASNGNSSGESLQPDSFLTGNEKSRSQVLQSSTDGSPNSLPSANNGEGEDVDVASITQMDESGSQSSRSLGSLFAFTSLRFGRPSVIMEESVSSKSEMTADFHQK